MQSDEKQFGKWDGGLLKDPLCVKTCTEQELFFLIDSYGAMIFDLNGKKAAGEIGEEIDIDPYQYALEYCAIHTTRFGVKLDEPKKGEHVKATDSYWAWYHWWKNYFYRVLSKEEYEVCRCKVEKGEDISSFRPNGDWRNNV